jgi:glutamate-1-semialdehyde 2,1-aminomutase
MATETTPTTIGAQLTARAERVMPGPSLGTFLMPEGRPFVAARGAGSKLYDVDGNAVIDYVLGSGPLILGHAHPAVVAAVARQAALGSQFYALNEPVIQLAERIVEAAPCAEKVKFTSTGSEANFLAMRLARAYTGRDKILKFEGGYHGHSDYAVVAYAPRGGVVYPVAPPDSAGVPHGAAGAVLVAPYNDAELAAELIEQHREELAAVIVEPYQRVIPPRPGFLAALRAATAANGVLLIFDEVVTGFRYAPGGAQEYHGVTPDLTTLAKILAGGLPGGAITGRTDLLERFLQGDDPEWQRRGRIPHPGTYNANPLSAAAGVACLELVKDPAVQRRATATADQLRAGFREALDRRGVAGQVGGEVSLVPVSFAESQVPRRTLVHRFRAALQLGGVDSSGFNFIVSATHGQAEVDQTVAAFDDALAMLQEEGAL